MGLFGMFVIGLGVFIWFPTLIVSWVHLFVAVGNHNKEAAAYALSIETQLADVKAAQDDQDAARTPR